MLNVFGYIVLIVFFQIKHGVILNFLKMMGPKTLIAVFVTMSAFQGMNIFSNFWLIYWTEDSLFKNDSLVSEYEKRTYYYLVMYLLFGLIQG